MRRRWYQRFLWPRILYWASLALLVLGLLIAAVGDTEGTVQEDRDTRIGGAALGFVGLAGLLGGKYWMDYAARSRNLVPCPGCGAAVRHDAAFCASCGSAVRATAAAPATAGSARPRTCPRCGMAQPDDALFCVSCGAHIGGGTPAAPTTA